MSTVRLLALFLVLGSASLWSADADLRFYSYEIVIEDRGHEETLSACPVYDNKETDPCTGFGVHAWMSNDKHWEALEAIYNKYAGREDWWYCSQTEYAAYRKMLQLHQLSAPVRDGNSVRYVLRLPYAADIGVDLLKVEHAQ